ncbi:hypothetical protein WA026_008688 [Henosepilachna vigintioctopunctata]|uniref:Rho-GAP domain-containing protein n=1 Tax=Henosepilachna vigintioctopunctata TaxID=420089 RepID=A0AAW1V2F5_9CUCU
MESEEALKYFINEVRDAPNRVVYSDERVLNEVEQAAEFLNKAGLTDLSKLYQEGKEIPDRLVKDSLSYRRLTQKQAETIKLRIRTLNKTVRSKQPRRKRQDIREVTWKIEDDKERSRSVDSHNSTDTPNEDITSDEDSAHMPSITLPLSPLNQKPKQKNLKGPISREKNKFGIIKDKGSDVANLGSENVVLKGYHIISENGTPPMRERSGSDPTRDIRQKIQDDVIPSVYPKIKVSKCVSAFTSTENGQQELLSFEGMVKENLESMTKEKDHDKMNWDYMDESGVCEEDLSDEDYQYLQPILYVELIAILDQYNIAYLKRKSTNKNKGGNVFGVNLSSLIMRDMTADSTMIPEIFLSLIGELNNRVKEDGILRIACQKQKLETLCNEIELNFYNNRSIVAKLMKEATAHELTGVLKRLLRDLPDPIFTVELCDMFYKTSLITGSDDTLKALNLLVLLLPVQHRRTFKLLIDFLLNVAKHEKYNRMNLHNVAMISAPSFFPPRFLLPKDSKINIKDMSKEELVKQINGAAVCCSIMESLLKTGDKLWIVPNYLARQALQAQKRAHQKREMPGKLKLTRSTTQYDPSTKSNPKLKKY